MNIVWFTWKDIMHPEAGGAEKISSEMAERLAKDGHQVTVLTSRFPGSKHEEDFSGYKIIRVGNRFTVYILAGWYFIKHLRTSTDLIIEEINTIPFMTQWYSKCKRSLVIYQLCREIWFYQIPFPISLIGYIFEPIYLFFLRKNYVITESNSTKDDLLLYGFSKNLISILPIFIDAKTSQSAMKKNPKTILSLGSVRPMKRTLDQVRAFELAKEKIADLTLIVAGDSTGVYGAKVKEYIKISPYIKDIRVLGKVTDSIKNNCLNESGVLLMTSIKEGWGLTVTEAASQGTSTIGYNVDGLRDSIAASKGGKIVDSNIESMASAIVEFILKNDNDEKVLISSTKNLSAENTYNNFVSICKKNHLFQ